MKSLLLCLILACAIILLIGCGGPSKDYCAENPHAPSCSKLYVP